MATKSPTPPPASEESRCGGEDVLLGEVLGDKYRIDARLAEGGMGVVLRATHLELDSAVAIKLLRSEHSHNEDVVARLLTEARIAASLRSKHVNRVLDLGRTAAGVPYLVLEYLEGSDLGGYLERRGPLPVMEAVDYVLQACEALAEAHAIGIVHRDMKPENLFLAEEADGGFVLKVLDFGISKAPVGRRGRTLTNPFEVVGSPTYMSPEQVRAGNVDARTDVWALGAVLYELCTGDIFFDEESLTSTFKRVLDPYDMPPPLEGGDEAARLHAIIVRCLEREPERRFQDMVELAEALGPLGSDALQAGRVVKVAAAAKARFIAGASATPSLPPLVGTPHALTTSRVERALQPTERVPAPRRRWWTWSVVAAAAVGILLGGVRNWSQQQEESATFSAPAAPFAEAPITPPPTPSPSPRAPSEVVEALPPTPLTEARAPAPPPWSKAPTARSSVLAPAPTLVASVAHAAPQPAEPPSLPESSLPEAANEETVTAGHEATSAEPEPTTHLQAPGAATATAESPTDPTLDAWDPKSFGGRK